MTGQIVLNHFFGKMLNNCSNIIAGSLVARPDQDAWPNTGAPDYRRTCGTQP
jgi:hypothetical protein